MIDSENTYSLKDLEQRISDVKGKIFYSCRISKDEYIDLVKELECISGIGYREFHNKNDAAYDLITWEVNQARRILLEAVIEKIF